MDDLVDCVEIIDKAVVLVADFGGDVEIDGLQALLDPFLGNCLF